MWLLRSAQRGSALQGLKAGEGPWPLAAGRGKEADSQLKSQKGRVENSIKHIEETGNSAPWMQKQQRP